MLNYEVLANIYKSRRNHKLDEWHTFCDLIESLPYSELITGKEKSMISIGDKVLVANPGRYNYQQIGTVTNIRNGSGFLIQACIALISTMLRLVYIRRMNLKSSQRTKMSKKYPFNDQTFPGKKRKSEVNQNGNP